MTVAYSEREDLVELGRKVRHRIDREGRWLIKISNLELLAHP
jgi:hypothetical protein